jgi:hypothetical protein
MTKTKKAFGGFNCPDGHGALIVMKSTKGGETTERLHCPHAAHNGRPNSHPLGKADPTPCFFTIASLEAAWAAKEVPA